MLGTSCTDEPPQNYEYQWRDFGSLAGGAHGNAIVALNTNILVGTDNGVQVYSSPEGNPATWQQTNLQGVKIVAFYVHPLVANVVLALGDPNAATNTAAEAFPVYRSTNSGLTWSAASEGLMDEDTEMYPPATTVSDKYVQTIQGGQYFADIYIGLGDNAIARSKDNGLTWDVVNGELAHNEDLSCTILIRQTFQTYLYQGCHDGVGQTYVDRFNLNNDNDMPLPGQSRLFDAAALGNKAVVGFERTLFSDAIFYVLLEGGVGAIADDQFRWVYEYPQGEGANTTMSFLWVNPLNFNNLVFGGYEQGNSTVFGMYDTPNHGSSVSLISPPAVVDLTAPQILDAYVAGSLGQDLLLLIQGQNGSGSVTKVFSRSQILPD